MADDDDSYSKWKDYCLTCMNKVDENGGRSFKNDERLQQSVIAVVPLWLIYFRLSSVLCNLCFESVHQFKEFMAEADNFIECTQNKGTEMKCATCLNLDFGPKDLIALSEVTQGIGKVVNRDLLEYLKWPGKALVCMRCSWVLHVFAGFRLVCEQSLVKKICTQPDCRGIVEFIPNRQRPMPYKFCTRTGQMVSEVSDNPMILQLYNEQMLNMKQQRLANQVLAHPEDVATDEQPVTEEYSKRSKELFRIVEEAMDTLTGIEHEESYLNSVEPEIDTLKDAARWLLSLKDEMVCEPKVALNQIAANLKFGEPVQPKHVVVDSNGNNTESVEEVELQEIEEGSNCQECIKEAEAGNAPNSQMEEESQAHYSYLFGWNEGHADTTLANYDKQTPVITCEWCTFTCSSKQELRLHFATHNQVMGTFKFRCRYCCSFFRSRKEHADHERIHKEQLSLPMDKRALLEK